MLDGACFHGFPEGIVGTSRGADNYSRSSFPLGKLIIIYYDVSVFVCPALSIVKCCQSEICQPKLLYFYNGLSEIYYRNGLSEIYYR